jgi:hypothetical protein
MRVHCTWRAIIATAVVPAIWAAGAYAGPAQNSSTPPPDLPKFAPASGRTGYQEIRLGDDTWYLAFYGDRENPLELIQAAWAARAAQLCDSVKHPYFVPLKYVSEAVLKSAPAAAITRADGRAYPVRGPVYIPIFIPQPAHGVIPAVTTPSKLAAFKCIDSPEKLLEPSRAVSTSEALASARTRGFKLP